MHIAVIGATGFIGSALCDALVRDDHEVTALVRNPARARASLPSVVHIVASDWGQSEDTAGLLARADAVVNLAGASVGGHRWTEAYKRELRESRIATTRAVVNAMAEGTRGGRVLVNASAVGYYGDRGDDAVTEATPPGEDFLARLCVDWESEALKAERFGIRVVLLRTGIVLGEGGALAKMLPPFRMGIGGPLGSGRQWMPWIHRADAVAMIRWAMERPDISGPINVTSPNPVTMREFATTLGRVLRRPALLPVPGFALKILLGEFASSILGGQKALPARAQMQGFEWRFPQLELALRDVIAGSGKQGIQTPADHG